MISAVYAGFLFFLMETMPELKSLIACLQARLTGKCFNFNKMLFGLV